MACVEFHVCWGFSQQETGLEMKRSKSCVGLEQEHYRFRVLNKTVIHQEEKGETATSQRPVITVLPSCSVTGSLVYRTTEYLHLEPGAITPWGGEDFTLFTQLGKFCWHVLSDLERLFEKMPVTLGSVHLLHHC